MEIVWREVAILSLERARTYIAQDNPAAALRVYDRILNSVRNLADIPNIGRPGRVEDTRELVVPNTPLRRRLYSARRAGCHHRRPAQRTEVARAVYSPNIMTHYAAGHTDPSARGAPDGAAGEVT
jgi:toxin ParE1/3/4